jgi:hypothetical protein
MGVLGSDDDALFLAATANAPSLLDFGVGDNGGRLLIYSLITDLIRRQRI